MARTPTPTANAPANAPAPIDAAAAAPAPDTTDTTDFAPPVGDDHERHEARVLNAFNGYEPNDIALLTEDELASRDGIDVDSHPAAIEYATSLIA
ncbi:hypothetical protein PX554_13765 [Sphingomonas sp. H39-1-10]|uniref:hypothetical protein n=1 Tax=Sphingomonas pollutisoli TaxID=3030829 RepID=UPI0023B8BEA6|nr:hypothetical protein [Sphingomonas pollutisoli]MDF0489203.1 hypothetical protein [Sphingomonas pollutisoli]